MTPLILRHGSRAPNWVEAGKPGTGRVPAAAAINHIVSWRRSPEPASSRAEACGMDDYEDCFAVLRDCFLVAPLERAAGEHHLEMAWYAVGVEWW